MSSDQIIGHCNSLNTLTSLIGPWLISGPKGVGKATLAYNLKDKLNIDNADFLLLEGYISIQQIRKILSFLSLSPLRQHRMILIDSAEPLSKGCANALLKVLEETQDCYIIIIGNTPVIPTIKSRCHKLKLKALTVSEMEEFSLRKFGLLADKYLEAARGSPGLLCNLMQHPQGHNEKEELTHTLTKFHFRYAELLRNLALHNISISTTRSIKKSQEIESIIGHIEYFYQLLPHAHNLNRKQLFSSLKYGKIT